jgi:hypothetical protein
VVLFSREDLEGYSKTFHVHGMNVSEVFSLAGRMGLPLPEDFLLVGIVASKTLTFGGSLDPELENRFEETYRNVLGAVRGFLEV